MELLREMQVRQDRFETRLGKIVAIQERQGNDLLKILAVLTDDVAKFDELIEMKQLSGKKSVFNALSFLVNRVA